AIISKAQIEKKVEDYLRDSQVLEDCWQRPITPEQLQAEMERMAHHTKQPDVLREIFQALGDDPWPLSHLVQRLIRRIHQNKSASPTGIDDRMAKSQSQPRVCHTNVTWRIIVSPLEAFVGLSTLRR